MALKTLAAGPAATKKRYSSGWIKIGTGGDTEAHTGGLDLTTGASTQAEAGPISIHAGAGASELGAAQQVCTPYNPYLGDIWSKIDADSTS